MPLKNSGNVIKNIELKKDRVTLYFEDFEVDISYDAYTSAYFYVGKELTKKEINILEESLIFSKYVGFARNLLTKKHYSENLMYQKILSQGARDDIAIKVVRYLKNIDLLNDEAYIFDILEYAKDEGFGKNKVKEMLTKEGFLEEQISAIKFPKETEIKKAKSLLKKLDKKYASYDLTNKKAHIFKALLTKGFSEEVAYEVTDLIKE